MDKQCMHPHHAYKKASKKVPSIQKEWSADNCLEFLRLHELYSNHWLQISQVIKSRSEHDIKNHFYSLLRKCIGKIIGSSYQFDGHLDLIQCYYISHHIVSYFTHMHANSKKEYLSTLLALKKVSQEQSSQYYSQLCIMCPYLKKVGWKNYVKEVSNLSGIQLYGYLLPNRILPVLSPEAIPKCLSAEDKSCFMEVWGLAFTKK
jgi:hypothetical protein